MSRYEIPTIHAGWTCVVGWDPPLGTFFAQVYRDVGPTRHWQLWVGTEIEEITTVEDLSMAIGGTARLSVSLRQQLTSDQAAVGFNPNFGTILLHHLRQKRSQLNGTRGDGRKRRDGKMGCVWVLVSILTALASGCTALRAHHPRQEATAPPLVEAKPVVAPAPQPLAPPTTSAFIDELPPDVRTALDTYVESGKAPLIDQTKAGFVRFPYGLSQPEVRCRPDAICDIELEPGEEVLDLGVADTVRWQFQPLREGPKDKRTVHVLVKPQDTVAMETGVVIGTDRRVYRIRIKSSPTAHVVNAKFYYPEDLVRHFNDAQAAAQQTDAPVAAKLPTVSIEDLHQNYQIEGQAAFAPVWVADDGQRTYLKMPPGLSTSGAPALFVEQDGQPALVNYTARGDYYVVQGVPQRMVLKRGVGRETQEVTVLRGK